MVTFVVRIKHDSEARSAEDEWRQQRDEPARIAVGRREKVYDAGGQYPDSAVSEPVPVISKPY